MSTSEQKNAENAKITSDVFKEIISIFHGIDKKIISLHDCSTEDFLFLNDYLKEVHNNIKKISANTGEISKIIDEHQNEAFFDKIDSLPKVLKTSMLNIENKLSETLDSVKLFIQQINMLFLPIKNFKQNLMTFKFLITNLKLNVSYYQREASVGQLAKQTEELNELIDNSKGLMPKIDLELVKLRRSAQYIENVLKDFFQQHLFTEENLISQIKSGITLLFVKHEKNIYQTSQLTDSTRQFSESIGKIITNLQYHDIIRQKMEHIQETHQELIKEINSLGTNGNQMIKKQQEYFARIPDIAELQARQLLHTNQEYQLAIENISNNFLQISTDMQSLSKASEYFMNHTFEGDKAHIKKIKYKFESLTESLQAFIEVFYEIQKLVKQINDGLKTFNSDFINVNKIKQKLQQVACKAIKEIQVKSPQKELDILSSQMNELANETEVIAADIEQKFDNLTNITENILTSADINNKSENKVDLPDIQHLNAQIKDVILHLDKNNNSIQKIHEKNKKSGDVIATGIKEAVQKIKYYDFFDKTIDEIINDLDLIIARLREIYKGRDKKDIIQHLSIAEKFYTTKSEHEIHGGFVSGNTKKGNREDDTNEDSLGDVELF